jgi:hypothetical protein
MVPIISRTQHPNALLNLILRLASCRSSEVYALDVQLHTVAGLPSCSLTWRSAYIAYQKTPIHDLSGAHIAAICHACSSCREKTMDIPNERSQSDFWTGHWLVSRYSYHCRSGVSNLIG